MVVATKTNRLMALLLPLFVAVNSFVHQRHVRPLESARRPFQASRLLSSKEEGSNFLKRIFEGDLAPPATRPKLEVGPSPSLPLSGGRASLLLIQAEALLAPAAEFFDEKTDGWALDYANLTPESEETVIGRTFLATNVAYAAAGLVLSLQGETLLGFMTEIVSVASFCYHYTQLQQPYNRTNDATVKLALTVDYILAITSIVIGLVYLLTDQTLPPIEGLVSAVMGIGCLLACWRWEQGMPYIVLHSLWHLFSALRYVLVDLYLTGCVCITVYWLIGF